jgi:hypothetical protein
MTSTERASIRWLQAKLAEAEADNRRMQTELAAAGFQLAAAKAEADWLLRNAEQVAGTEGAAMLRRHHLAIWRGEPE